MKLLNNFFKNSVSNLESNAVGYVTGNYLPSLCFNYNMLYYRFKVGLVTIRPRWIYSGGRGKKKENFDDNDFDCNEHKRQNESGFPTHHLF